MSEADAAELRRRIDAALLLVGTVEAGIFAEKAQSPATPAMTAMCLGLRALLTLPEREATARLDQIMGGIQRKEKR